MSVHSENIQLSTKGFTDIHDITSGVANCLERSGVKQGIVTVAIPGSTGSVTTIEYESGAVNDLKEAIERLAPQEMHYQHDARWGDGNGFSHVRSALLGPSITVPVQDEQLVLGTWQQIIFIDFDNRPRQRSIAVQIIGE